MLRNIVNCKNCGAPLHYNFKNRIATCEYCTSEYHLDDLGIIEEYKPLKEVDGHTPMEVLCGCLLGFFVGLSFSLLK